MKKTKVLFALGLGLAFIAMPLFVFGQKTPAAPAAPQILLKRVVTKEYKAAFGAGGTVTVIGAPAGSITVIGSNKNELAVTAEIELQAPTEADLALMAQVNGITVDPSPVHTSVFTYGLHDKEFMKKNAKKFPKNLLTMPWKIDYVVHVPAYTDIEVTVGKGLMTISGVEGASILKGTDIDADLTFSGGTVNAAFGTGNVNVKITSRSWRGRNLNMQLARGTLNLVLPEQFNADIDASVLRTGEIKNFYTTLKPRDEAKVFTKSTMAAKAGGGGALLTFVLGDGVMTIADKKIEP
jgi:hypothetical protein